MSQKVIRVALFKVPLKENQLKFEEMYKILAKTARKDGVPYILSVEAGPTHLDERDQGYTFVAKTEFSSLGDMKYYDADCEAHSMLKAATKNLGVQGFMIVYYSPAVVAGL